VYLVGVGFLICCRLMSASIDDLLTSNSHLYADDFQVYAEQPCDISDCIHRLNVDLEAIFRCSGLSLNSRKTQAMII
jgi:hypothetical protein